MEKLDKKIESYIDKVGRFTDKYGWWFIGICAVYFIGRTLLSVVWNI